MFFVRITEWGWDEAPPRVPMFPGDLPRQDHPLPRALDDAGGTGLLRTAQGDRRMLVRVTVEIPLHPSSSPSSMPTGPLTSPRIARCCCPAETAARSTATP